VSAPLRVMVVDDETLARSRLITLLGDCQSPAAQVVAQAANAVQAMGHAQHMPLDLVLLDIHMPGASGLVLARELAALPSAPALVFVTAHSEHAVEAFEVEALDYLTKPVRLERLQAALRKAERVQLAHGVSTPAMPEASLLIQERNRTERVPLAEVLYARAELKYLTVCTDRRSYTMDGTLGELEAQHPAYFLRIHRNTLVARHAMRALEKHDDPERGEAWALRLHGVDEPLSVSRRQLASVRELLAGS
jgi:two-component system, LytTR family, response regulator AlgR